MPPQMPRPPSQIANGPHQWSGIWLGVVMQEVDPAADQTGREAPPGDVVDEVGIAAALAPSGAARSMIAAATAKT